MPAERRRLTIKRASEEAILIKGQQREAKGDNKESGCRRYTKRGAPRFKRRATIKIADAEAIQIKCPQSRRRTTIKRADAEATQIKGQHREEKGDNKENGRRGYTARGSAGGG